MNKVYFIAVIFASTVFLFFPGTVLSQQEERLAVVSEYEGVVKVEHESILKTVKKIGNRIRNSAVYEDGSVMTMHASTADLVFNDNTSLQIDEKTSLTIRTREVSGEEKADDGFIRQVSGKQSEIVRNIHITAGKILANITPSKSVLTEFETPTGVASVRGTVVTLAYIAGVTSIDLMQGLIDFADAGKDVSFSVEPGDNIDISLSELGHSSIGVNTGQIDVAT
ncbi:MAG TPA: FecR domain-containing protein, partial [Candidatus Scalindua sp.]|nr:FecR domain-containing protein [Candidatus Scalindua sp.]